MFTQLVEFYKIIILLFINFSFPLDTLLIKVHTEMSIFNIDVSLWRNRSQVYNNIFLIENYDTEFN